jgi:DNA-binding transcriptional LysR family regulator
MTLYQLKIFEAVAKHLNITQAALELHASQPAVSQQLKLLEDNYGSRFLARHSHGVKLTEKGREFLEAIKPVLVQLEDIERRFKQKQNGKTSQCLAVGGSHNVSVRVFPKLLRTFRESHPALQFMLASNESAVIEKQLLNGELEIAIISNPSHRSEFIFEPYDRMEVVAFCLPTHPLAGKTLSLKELTRYPLIAKSAGRIEKVLASQGQGMNLTLRCEMSEAVKAAVRMGMGIGILYKNAIARPLANGNLKVVHVPELKALGIKSYIAYDQRRPLSPIAQEFLELLLQTKQSGYKNKGPVVMGIGGRGGRAQKIKKPQTVVARSSRKYPLPNHPSVT